MVTAEGELAMNSHGKYSVSLAAGIGLVTALAGGTVLAQPAPHDTFNPHDTRVFRSVACTQDHRPVEALYYIVASRSDMASSKSSPSSQLMKEEVDKNWRDIAARLTGEQVMEERFATTYHSTLSEHIPRLQQAVEEQSGVSISVTEVNSRPMDPARDKDVPPCSPQ
jgi:hypothetical protein